jgi:hypothetical protein
VQPFLKSGLFCRQFASQFRGYLFMEFSHRSSMAIDFKPLFFIGPTVREAGRQWLRTGAQQDH